VHHHVEIEDICIFAETAGAPQVENREVSAGKRLAELSAVACKCAVLGRIGRKSCLALARLEGMLCAASVPGAERIHSDGENFSQPFAMARHFSSC
jgi:hypothetical protein